MTSAIDRLAQHCGIQAAVKDARGQELITSIETKQALLSGMGFDASTEATAAAALEHIEDQHWKRSLPVVMVANASETITLPVTLPKNTREVKWALRLEGGAGQRTGCASFNDLQVVGERNKGDVVLQRRSLTLREPIPWGYHKLQLVGQSDELTLIVTPGSCWLPEALRAGERIWGLSAQLYLQRSKSNWGIGDFSDLRTLVGICRSYGADVMGLNPLHAMFPDRPNDASPYSPSDRTLLNIFYVDVETVPEFAISADAQRLVNSEAFRTALNECRAAALVDYEQVAGLKMDVLHLLFDTFNATGDQKRLADFKAFHQDRSALLDRACVFQALQAHFAVEGIRDIQDWPEDFKTCDSLAVSTFAHEHADLVRFHLWLQWIADTQLHAAAEDARAMVVGLYRDLAVGVHSSGAEGWAHPGLMANNIQVGAPPDIWNPAGQNWGLPAAIPQSLTQSAYKPFIELLQANMRYAGAIRIDHAMALQRLYWIPANATAAEGAYVRYPLEDLIGVLALESHRNHCLVIGEDLGTVPEGFRERMAEANVLSYRVLLFQKEEETFLPPEKYPPLSVSVASSHDLPTLQGWWHEQDLDTKDQLQLFPSLDLAKEAREQRRTDRQSLSQRLAQDLAQLDHDVIATAFCSLVHAFLAKTTSLVTLVQLDDVTEELNQVNVPATTTETPNWRRKQSITLEDLSSGPRLQSVMQSMAEGRKRMRHARQVQRHSSIGSSSITLCADLS